MTKINTCIAVFFVVLVQAQKPVPDLNAGSEFTVEEFSYPLFSSFDENDMSVLNQYAEVQVGTTIYKQLNAQQIASINAVPQKGEQKSTPGLTAGAYLEIKDANYAALIAFNEGNLTVLDHQSVSIGNSTDYSASKVCEQGKTTRVFRYPASKRRIKAIVKVPQPKFGWNGKVKTKIKSYKKRRRRGWKKWRTLIATWPVGRVYNGGCASTDFEDLIDPVVLAPSRRKKIVFISLPSESF